VICGTCSVSKSNLRSGLASQNTTPFSKERLGWLNNGASPSISTVQTAGTYILNTYELAGPGPNALKILKSTDPATGARTWYYVEARQAIGFDAFLTDGSCGPCYTQNETDGVLAHIGTDGDGDSSELLDMTLATPTYYWWFDPSLAAGQSFTDPASGVTLTASSVTSSTAAVTVQFAVCGRHYGRNQSAELQPRADRLHHGLGDFRQLTRRQGRGELHYYQSQRRRSHGNRLPPEGHQYRREAHGKGVLQRVHAPYQVEAESPATGGSPHTGQPAHGKVDTAAARAARTRSRPEKSARTPRLRKIRTVVAVLGSSPVFTSTELDTAGKGLLPVASIAKAVAMSIPRGRLAIVSVGWKWTGRQNATAGPSHFGVIRSKRRSG
jgi:hypothetical protein